LSRPILAYSDPIRRSRRHAAISRPGRLYAAPSLCGSTSATRETFPTFPATLSIRAVDPTPHPRWRRQTVSYGRPAPDPNAQALGANPRAAVPTRQYGANSAWKQLSVLAHNLIRSFQLDTLAAPKPRSRKRTYTFLIRSMRTLRFLRVTRAGRLTRIGDRHVLRLSHNPATEALYASIHHRLAA
jgi:hypothetical protein